MWLYLSAVVEHKLPYIIRFLLLWFLFPLVFLVFLSFGGVFLPAALLASLSACGLEAKTCTTLFLLALVSLVRYFLESARGDFLFPLLSTCLSAGRGGIESIAKVEV